MVATLTDVEHGVEVGRLSRRGEHACHATLEGCNLGRYGIVRGVLQAGIEIAAVLKVEEAGHLLAVVVLECGALINGQHARLALLGCPALLHAEGLTTVFLFHNILSLNSGDKISASREKMQVYLQFSEVPSK